MNSLQVEERSAESSSASKSPFLLYVLLVVITIYITMSSYRIFNTLSRLESTEAGQWASIEKLKQRQSQTEREITASNDALAQRLGVAEQDLQFSLQVRAGELQRQQQDSQSDCRTRRNSSRSKSVRSTARSPTCVPNWEEPERRLLLHAPSLRRRTRSWIVRSETLMGKAI